MPRSASLVVSDPWSPELQPRPYPPEPGALVVSSVCSVHAQLTLVGLQEQNGGWMCPSALEIAKMVLSSARTSKVDGECKNGNCQCLSSWKESQQIHAPPAVAVTLTNESPHVFQLLFTLLLLH